MTLREERRFSCLRHPDHEDTAPGGDATPLVLSGVSALSGASVGCLVAGNGYAGIGLVAAAFVAGWIGWWARGLT